MVRPDRESTGSQQLIDEALGLLDTLQRKLVVAGVRHGMAAATPTTRKEDVWEEAVREEPRTSDCGWCPVCRVVGAAREAGPEVAAHLDQAGSALRAALREAVDAYERSRRPPDGAGDARAEREG